MSNISYKSNTKINLYVNSKYFLPLKHKKIKTQIFSQTQNHNLLFAKCYKYSQQFKHRIMQYFRHKKSRKVLRNEFSSGETVYVGTKAVCGKNHKRASTAYGCKYILTKMS